MVESNRYSNQFIFIKTYSDEMDVNLMVDEKKVKDWLEFDRVNQVVKIKHGLPVGHPLGENNSI